MALKISVDDRRPAFMKVIHPTRSVGQHTEHDVPPKVNRGVVKHLVQTASRHVLHDDDHIGRFVHSAQELQHIWRSEIAHEVHLLFKLAGEAVVDSAGHELLGGNCGPMPDGAVDFAETTPPDALFQVEVLYA